MSAIGSGDSGGCCWKGLKVGSNLNELNLNFRLKADKLLAALEAAGIRVKVITTGRSLEAQAEAVAHGVSWTKHGPHQDGAAIDVAPPELMSMKNWAPGHPLWKQIGEIGCSLGLGLVWGGTWRRDSAPPYGGMDGNKWDPGHFEDGDWRLHVN